MKTRLTLVVAATVLMLLPLELVAAERATFILRNGQRESGVVVAHGDQRANLILGYFNLGDMPGGTGNLREKAYPQADVAVIDFAAGTPSQQELSGLNRMNGQPNMVALRSGELIYGRFDNIIDGATVTFVNQQGQNQRYAARDVARVYLDTQAARTIFNVAPDPAPTQQNRTTLPSVPSQRNRNSAPQDQGSAGLRVPADRAWTDTGIDVRRGDRVSFRASGQIQFGPSDRDVADGNSRYRADPAELVVDVMPIGGLIGQIDRGAPFAIGANARSIVMRSDGRLYLGVNVRSVSGNRGAFLVEILPGR